MAAQATPLRPSTPIAAVHAPVVVASEAGRTNVVRWLAAVPVLVIGGIVLLYGLGALWKWGQVREAGLDPIDVLPLVPRDQLVTLGTELVLLTLVALPLTFGLVLVLHLALPDEGRAWGVPLGLARLTAEQDRLRRDIAELRAYAGHDELVARRARRMTTRSDRIRARLTHRTRAARLGLALAAVAGVAVSAPGRIAVAAFGLWMIRRHGGGILRAALVVFTALLLVVVAERFAAPEPLPDTSVRTTRGVLVKAPLLAQTRDAWYLVVDDRRLKAIPMGAIAKSSVAFAPRREPGFLGARVADVLP